MQNIDISVFDKLYLEATQHHKEHKCGGAPYKSYKELYEFLHTSPNLSLSKRGTEHSGNTKKTQILEIGTATGLMTTFFATLFPKAEMQSLELEKTHVELATKLLEQPSPARLAHLLSHGEGFSSSKIYIENRNKIQIIHCDAFSYMQYCPRNTYDIIFFDGFKPDIEFLNQYERILKNGGILISANSHLSQNKTKEYFDKLSDETKWKKLTSFGDTIIYQKLF
jgi:predicted O-methyltransferase YrrM